MHLSIEGSHASTGTVDRILAAIRDRTDPNTGTAEGDDARALLRWSPGAWHSTVTLRLTGVIEVAGFWPDARPLSDIAQALRLEGFEVSLRIEPVTFGWWLVRLTRPRIVPDETPIVGIPQLPVARVKPCFLRATPAERRRALSAGVYYEHGQGSTAHELLGEMSA